MFAGCALTGGCEKVELPSESFSQGVTEPSDADSSGLITAPITGTGQGTVVRPYTVTDLLEGGDTLMNHQLWVLGYVVGWTYQSLSNAEFTAENAEETNVLLADNPEEDDPYGCLPVRLTSAKWKKAIGLKQNPDSLGRCIRVLGLVGRYMTLTSITEVHDYQWLGGWQHPAVSPGDDEPQQPDPGPGDDPSPGEEEEPQPGDDEPSPGGQRRDTVPVIEEGGVLNGGRAPGYFRRIKARRERL